MSDPDYLPYRDRLRLERVLLDNMHAQATQLRALLDEVNAEDSKIYQERCFYRFYHYSAKVFDLQGLTTAIVDALAAIAPEGVPFCELFQTILRNGIGRKPNAKTNEHWGAQTAPIVQAFLHARYFLEMAVKYEPTVKTDDPTQGLPSGWAALLELFGIR